MQLRKPNTGPQNWQVFLSSTILDLRAYRKVVLAELEKRGVDSSPCENWPKNFQKVSDLCRQRVYAADGYALILGHWYGWIPQVSNPERKSITHLEFKWAYEKWGDLHLPPIRLYVPQPGSAADKDLENAAEQLINAKPSGEHQHYTSGIEKFRQEVQALERQPSSFETRQKLAQDLVITCEVWKGITLEAAARGLVHVDRAVRSRSGVSDELLGRLGRRKHMQTLDTLLLSLESADVPAACVLVSGGEFAGQSEFVTWVLDERKIPGRYSGRGRPPIECDFQLLPSWVAAELGFMQAAASGIQTVEELAEHIAGELQSQSMYFILDGVQHLSGRAAEFHQSIWTPLFERLSELRSQTGFRNKLVVLLVSYGRPALSGAVACGPDYESEEPDYAKILLLPELADFAQPQIKQWLTELKAPKESIDAVSKQVMRDDHGRQDGIPKHVFDRLRMLDLKVGQNWL